MDASGIGCDSIEEHLRPREENDSSLANNQGAATNREQRVKPSIPCPRDATSIDTGPSGKKHPDPAPSVRLQALRTPRYFRCPAVVDASCIKQEASLTECGQPAGLQISSGSRCLAQSLNATGIFIFPVISDHSVLMDGMAISHRSRIHDEILSTAAKRFQGIKQDAGIQIKMHMTSVRRIDRDIDRIHRSETSAADKCHSRHADRHMTIGMAPPTSRTMTMVSDRR